jgi:drug/metabolite transporter (DMT)-like permease
MISRHVFWKCALVIFLLVPLVLLEGWHTMPPSWLSHCMGGVPMTAIASVALFFALTILTAIYSVLPATPPE